jgi:hypothetical protein
VYVEADFDRSVRLRFPQKGGLLKLLEQRPLVQDVVREAIDLGLHDLAFKNAYPHVASRAAAAQVLLRRAAKKLGSTAILVAKRAKKDIEFCRQLAPLVWFLSSPCSHAVPDVQFSSSLALENSVTTCATVRCSWSLRTTS